MNMVFEPKELGFGEDERLSPICHFITSTDQHVFLTCNRMTKSGKKLSVHDLYRLLVIHASCINDEALAGCRLRIMLNWPNYSLHQGVEALKELMEMSKKKYGMPQEALLTA